MYVIEHKTILCYHVNKEPSPQIQEHGLTAAAAATATAVSHAVDRILRTFCQKPIFWMILGNLAGFSWSCKFMIKT